MKKRNMLLDMMIDSTHLAMEAQSVIQMRMMLFAFGGPKAEREKRLMVEEKLKAAHDIMVSTVLDVATGGDPTQTMPKAIKSYRKIVGKNKQRLSGN